MSTYFYRSTNNALHTETQSVSRVMRTSEETTYSIHKRLHDIQKYVAETRNTILSQNNAIHCILRSAPCSHERQLTPSVHKASLPKHTPWSLPGVSCKISSNDSRCTNNQWLSHTAGEGLSGQEESPDPQSLFEMSANFFPEVYTTDQRLPRLCLVVISSFEDHLGQNSKRNIYRLFYQKSPRQWCRINIILEIPRHSIYWAATKTSRDEITTAGVWVREAYAPLPFPLISQFQSALLRLPSVEQVSASVSTTTRLW